MKRKTGLFGKPLAMAVFGCAAVVAGAAPAADLTFERLVNPEPQNWLTYWGDLRGTHYSGLKQVTPANASALKSAWTYQLGGNTVETTPLVVNGLIKPFG